jgi:UPF0755 protein
VRRNRLQTAIIAFIVFGFVCVIGAGALFLFAGDDIMAFARTVYLRISLASREDELNAPMSADVTIIRFSVYSGEGVQSVADRLFSDGLISDVELFVEYSKLAEVDSQIQAGTFFLSKSQNIKEIAQALTNSNFSYITFTIVPGWRIEQVADVIDATRPYFNFSGADFLAVVGKGAVLPPNFVEEMGIPAGSSLEGFLYPDTYRLPPDVTPLELRRILLDAFSVNFTEEMRQSATQQRFTVYEIVTLASILQKEALYDVEHPVIASVYRNRLDEDWTLDADPTVQYEHPNVGKGNWWPRITRADYRGVDSTYNTYLYKGLPPGPIAIPSLSAMNAALNPMVTPFFFFRADCRGDGYHDFSITYDEHRTLC